MNNEFRKPPACAPSPGSTIAAMLGLLIISVPILAPARILALTAPASTRVLKTSGADQDIKRQPHTSGLTPANPAVTPGNSITITSANPVTWSLSGVGTISNQTSTTVTYTAPASVVPQNQMLGCPVLPNDTVFNTPVDNLPLDPNSTAMIAAQSQGSVGFQPSWGISFADNSTPTRTLIGYYDSLTYSNFAFPPAGPNLKRESGDYVGVFQFSASPDHHVMTVRHTDCSFYESYDDYLNGYSRTCNDGVTQNCNVQSATAYTSSTYNWNPAGWGTDAAGLLLAPLVWHVDEIKSGTIKHAVRFTEGLGGILFGGIRWPAAGTAGGCSVCPHAMPMGTRLRLKASFSISSFSATAQTALTALKKYGMILADTGSNNAIQTTTDVGDDATVAAALAQISAANINISNFEVVDESSLQFAANSYAVCPYNHTCLGAANTYEQPVTQAMITATQSGGSSTSMPIALQGISIGLGVPTALPLQAGSYSFQIPYWVNNTSNQTVNWALQSGVGAVTSAGVYTPPSTTTNSSTTATAVLQGTSAADSNIVASLYITVLPAGANPAGSIRIDSGASAGTTDSNGNSWLPDTGAEGTSVEVPGDYPTWTTTNPLRIVYQSAAIAYANDLRYALVVPNGNYKVHLLFGVPYNGCPPPCGYYAGYYGADIHTYNPQILETQGVIKSHFFDFGALVGYAFGTPADIYIPAKVTNNLLNIGVAATAPDVGPNYAPASGPKYNIVNGVEILPDPSAAHWTIDTQQQTTISSGKTLLPLYVTDWYTGVNDPTWTLVSGPPGASLNGSTLSLAAGTYLNGQPIVIKASDGTYSATATLFTSGGTKSALGIIVAPAAINHFSYKRAITINHSHVSGAQTSFPVELSLSDPTLETVANGGHVQQANGYDIVLTSDSAGVNRLNWEVEKYDPVGGTWIADVNIPSLSSTVDTVIYLFYGNSAITANQSTPAAVWDSNYTGVYHFATVTASTTPDSTSNNNGAISNDGVTLSGLGQIGSAAQFNGSGTGYHLVLPVAVLHSPSGTLSAWVNSSIAMVSGQTYGTGGQTDGSKEFRFLEWSSYYNGTLFGWNGGTTDYSITLPNTTLSIPTNTWSHVAYTWNQAASTQVIYVNGVAVSTVSTAFTPYSPIDNFYLGTDPANQSYNFSGFMDEVRFSKTNRSSGWIATEYANQSSPSTFVGLGGESPN